MSKQLPHGSWPSSISAAQVAAGTKPLGGAAFAGDEVIIQQARPEQGGRITLWRHDAASGERRQELIPREYNVRSRVHEYGGASWVLLPGAEPDGWGIVFANFTDQRLYLISAPGAAPVALTPPSLEQGNPTLRFAELVPTAAGDAVLAIMEDLCGEPVRHIVAVPLDASAATDRAALNVLTPPARFVAFPRLSPDARQLAWISWEHPNMPWDGTELHLAALTGTSLRTAGLADERVIAGSGQTSVLQPEWVDGQRLAFISDASGWWNPYLYDVAAGTSRPLLQREEEFAGPLWQVGTTWYTVESENTLLVSHGTGLTGLSRLRIDDGQLQPLRLPVTRIRPLQLCGRQLLAATSSMTQGEQISLIDLAAVDGWDAPGGTRDEAPTGDEAATRGAACLRPLARAIDQLPPADQLPQVEELEARNADGEAVHALLYRPRNQGYRGPEGHKPPFITMVHGGPTSQAAATLSATIAYYTSRGIGVVDVNYGGSSGYGRAYRNRLRGQWGVVDVADTVAVIDALIERGIADPQRIGIEGGSAGGWTVLSALTNSDRFTAGISRYGVSDLVALVADTHDFESQYMFSLVGPYPQEAELYAQRAPINHLQDISCPVLVLQGDEDKVVPPAQSQVVVDELARRGIPHAYLLFAGEQHGFRQEANIIAALEASLAFYAQVFGFEADVPPLELS